VSPIANHCLNLSVSYQYFSVILSSQICPREEEDLKSDCLCCKYNSSTFLRAHGVLRKNFKLDLMLGSCVKQRTGTAAAIASQPMLSDSCVTIASSVMPSKGGRFAGFLVVLMFAFYSLIASLERLQCHT